MLSGVHFVFKGGKDSLPRSKLITTVERGGKSFHFEAVPLRSIFSIILHSLPSLSRSGIFFISEQRASFFWKPCTSLGIYILSRFSALFLVCISWIAHIFPIVFYVLTKFNESVVFVKSIYNP